MNTTSVFNKNLAAFNSGYRYIVNKGSTRSSKTYSIMQLLIFIAKESSKPLVISIVSMTMPHLKKGCIRDFEDIMRAEKLWIDNNWNATDKIYRLNNSIIEFFSTDSPSKVHGPARDILYINECINISYSIYNQLAIRTRGTILLDCNPNFEFWMDTKVLQIPKSVEDPKVLIDNPDVAFIHSTYLDNEYLTEAQIKEIESNKHDKNWWQVYGLGLTGSFLGAIMENWDVVDDMPSEYKNRWVGVDFGYTNDPTAIIDIRLSEGDLWIDEILFDKGFDNMMIADTLKDSVSNNVEIIADSAEPKSIAEIRSKGLRIHPAIKGKDSIILGLSILNRYKKHITRRSVNVINEFKNYRWKVDIDDNPLNEPIDKFNHTIDAIRYVALSKLKANNYNFSYQVMDLTPKR